MPVTRSRTTADIRREIVATERRLGELVDRWRSSGTSASISVDPPAREALDRVEEMLRYQRGAVDRLHQLWIELAQAVGQHAPQ
jgi:hypothetical protein